MGASRSGGSGVVSGTSHDAQPPVSSPSARQLRLSNLFTTVITCPVTALDPDLHRFLLPGNGFSVLPPGHW